MLVFRPQTGANSNRTPSPKADYMFWFHSAIHLRIWILDNATHPGLRGRGVSHHQTSSIQGVSHCQIGYPLNPVYPWFTYRGRLAQNLKESIQKRSNLFCPLLFVLASQRAPDAAFGGNKKSVGNKSPHSILLFVKITPPWVLRRQEPQRQELRLREPLLQELQRLLPSYHRDHGECSWLS